MIGFRLGIFLLLALPVAACTAPREPRKCPMGSLAHIEAPERIAMQTAAEATAKYGYTNFTVLRNEGSGDSYKMLIKMSDVGEDEKTSFVSYGLMARLR